MLKSLQQILIKASIFIVSYLDGNSNHLVTVTLFNTHKGFTIGLRKTEKVSKGDCTIFHIKVDDVSNYISKATGLGGHISRGKTTIPAMGYYALITDLDGNTIGLYQGN